jgi:hypothetical protein
MNVLFRLSFRVRAPVSKSVLILTFAHVISMLLLSKLLFFFVITLLSWGFWISCFFLFLFIILFSSFLVLGHLLHFPIFFS